MEFFKLWSETNPDALKTLKPNLGLRNWQELTPDEKNNIWLIMRNKKWFVNSENIYNTIYELNDLYKYNSFGRDALSHGGPHKTIRGLLQDCCLDISYKEFNKIFLNAEQNIVFETISLFSELLIYNSYFLDGSSRQIKSDISEDLLNQAYQAFDRFALDLNDVFDHYGINIILSRLGFVIKQDEKIYENVYKPVTLFLSNPKWEKVNDALKNAFLQYQMRTPDSYSSCITYGINAVQAYLQLIVYGDVGKVNIKELIRIAITKKLLPDDKFSHIIFNDLEAYFMSERQRRGTSHPSKEYANEKNARLMLNLVMVFLQHCIQG